MENHLGLVGLIDLDLSGPGPSPCYSNRPIPEIDTPHLRPSQPFLGRPNPFWISEYLDISWTNNSLSLSRKCIFSPELFPHMRTDTGPLSTTLHRFSTL